MSKSNFVVALLLINRIDFLPEIAIKSIRKHTDSYIYIGYVNQFDVNHLIGISHNVKFVDLSKNAKKYNLNFSDRYQDYLSNNFFQLVQLKWNLLLEVLNLEKNKHVIYNDLDVIWLRDITRLFTEKPNISNKLFFIQDVSREVEIKDLCMGVAIMKNSHITKKILKECLKLHQHMLKENANIGDDSVITTYYNEIDKGKLIDLLPQFTFPAGYLLNSYSKNGVYPGFEHEIPYIFHANYVVGIRKKLLLIYLLCKQFGISKVYFKPAHRVSLFCEIKLRKFKNKIS